jgi:transposase-like protein
MSRGGKREAVLRLLRGEELETVSRSLGVTAATLSGWRDAFLSAGEASLASRPADGEVIESKRLKARLGEMPLERELLEAKIAALEAGRPWPGGSRSYEPHDFPERRQALRRGPGMPDLAGGARHGLSAPRPGLAYAAATPRSDRADARR